MKKAFLIPSMIFSILYPLPLVLDAFLLKAGRYGGTLERIVLLGMDAESFGVVYILLIPLIPFVFALAATLCSKQAAKTDRLVYVVPPILAGLPTAYALFCVLTQWSLFDLSVEWAIHPVRLYVCFGIWFFACLYLLLKPVVLRKRPNADP